MSNEIEHDMLASLVEELKALITIVRQCELTNAYEVGKILCRGYRQYVGGGHMHENTFFRLLASRTGVTRPYLLTRYKLRTTFTAAQWRRIVATPAMTVSKASMLADVEDVAVREALRARIGAENLTLANIVNIVNPRPEAVRSLGASRPSVIPADIATAIDGLRKTAASFCNKSQTIWFGPEYDICAALESASFDEITEEVERQMRNAIENVTQLVDVAEETLIKTRRAARIIERRKRAGE